MADQSPNLRFQTGETKGHAQVEKDQVVDEAKHKAESAVEACQQASQSMKDQLQGATDALKDATGINKNC